MVNAKSLLAFTAVLQAYQASGYGFNFGYQGILNLEALNEGPCKDVTAAPGINATAVGLPEVTYFPMASLHTYYLHAQALGQSPRRTWELDQMNIVAIHAFGVTTLGGYGGRMYSVTETITDEDYGVLKIAPIIGVPGTNPSSFSTIEVTLVSLSHGEDGSFYNIGVRCVDGESADWALVSNRQTVPDKVKAEVRKKVIELGFREELIWSIRYKNY